MAFRILKSIERDMRNALRRDIRKKGLIDTGALVESIEVFAEIDDFGVMDVHIDAVDYIKYLWEPFKLDEFIRKDNLLDRAYMEWLGEKSKQFPLVEWKARFKPKVVFNLPD